MSALIVAHDLHIMMVELSVEKLYVPRTSVFDSALMKKTRVMFRMLDDEWMALYPHRSDYRPYRGSNYESEPFYGGKSIVFSIPEASLQKRMTNVDLQMHIIKEVSRYFEMHPSQNVGFVIVKLDKLFNGIIKELRERKELAPYLNFHEREPISRSMKETFPVLNDNSEETGSKINLYVRISYFGKSIITEIATPEAVAETFYVQEETNEMYPYQCRELKPEEIECGFWESVTVIPPTKPQNLKCDCQNEKTKELLEMQRNADNKNEDVPTKDAGTIKETKDDDKEKEEENGTDKGKINEKGKRRGKIKSKVSDEDDQIRNDNTEMSDFSNDEKKKEKGNKEKDGAGKEKLKDDNGKGKEDKGKVDKQKGNENEKRKDEGKRNEEKKQIEDRRKPKDEANGRKETSLFDPERIRRLRRRHAGPCTVGISGKKLTCLPAPLSEHKKYCPNLILTPCIVPSCQLSPCPLPFCCPPINCNLCQESSTFGCC
ncbi:uncharacterized protein LOC117178081 isoform X2 [Belonocnema kinseyi]|uniref:uncharacterized protein LOC117178081 isoform X2 n=1 Tax=Belonocnema kinseyi TaxID=2817044 RepID=UPI00143CDE69|nr:uncharacterized protein LOC117178081 isoform X2 [Belonocnema kinseyi]